MGYSMPGGVMVARLTLDQEIGVQIPAGQPRRAPHVTEVPRKARKHLQKRYLKNLQLEPFLSFEKIRSNPDSVS